jgi:hypothetical protein
MSTRYVCDWCGDEYADREQVAYADVTINAVSEKLHLCVECAPDHLRQHHPEKTKRKATDGGQQTADGSGRNIADAGDADARASKTLPSAGKCRFPSGRGYCDGQHVLDPDSLLEDGFVRFPCRREECDAETVMPRGIGIERLDNAGFDVAALARRGDTQLGSVWLDCPDCGARGSILAEGDLECQECDETFDPEEVW